MNLITVSAWQRPDCLEQVLSALDACDGRGEYRVFGWADYGPLQAECLRVFANHRVLARGERHKLGCTRTIGECLRYGAMCGGDFHIHLEDDCVPAKGALRWFEWAAKQYKDDQSVMTVAGWAHEPTGQANECRRTVDFKPWGWGIWRDRLMDLLNHCAFDPMEGCWDTQIMANHLKGRHLVHPCISRIQNIGKDRAAHVPNPEFHAKYHHAKAICDDIVSEFVEIQ